MAQTSSKVVRIITHGSCFVLPLVSELGKVEFRVQGCLGFILKDHKLQMYMFIKISKVDSEVDLSQNLLCSALPCYSFLLCQPPSARTSSHLTRHTYTVASSSRVIGSWFRAHRFMVHGSCFTGPWLLAQKSLKVRRFTTNGLCLIRGSGWSIRKKSDISGFKHVDGDQF